MPYIIVTGLSGGGKSTALRTLEDAGFFINDNLPPELWLPMSKLAADRQMAVSTDARTRDFLTNWREHYDRLKAERDDVRVVFLEAEPHILLGRYNLSRREHPLGEGNTLMVDFAREKELLAPLRAVADFTIDTTALSAAQLSERLLRLLDVEHPFCLRLVSFGFKHTPPSDADLVIDVRSMPNPFYDIRLRPHNGLNEEVAHYVFADVASQCFYAQLRDFVKLNAERAAASGRKGYTVAVGCTGGQHRSVAVAAKLAQDLPELTRLVHHRDMSPGPGEMPHS